MVWGVDPLVFECLDPPEVPFYPFWGTKIDCRKQGSLILTSLQDLEANRNQPSTPSRHKKPPFWGMLKWEIVAQALPAMLQASLDAEESVRVAAGFSEKKRARKHPPFGAISGTETFSGTVGIKWVCRF